MFPAPAMPLFLRYTCLAAAQYNTDMPVFLSFLYGMEFPLPCASKQLRPQSKIPPFRRAHKTCIPHVQKCSHAFRSMNRLQFVCLTLCHIHAFPHAHDNKSKSKARYTKESLQYIEPSLQTLPKLDRKTNLNSNKP